ncbi:MAG: hypothetical protein ACE5MM_01130 [Nitrospiraceae bacterium]
MTTQEARQYLNHLMTLCVRKEQAFAPLALKFVKEEDLDQLGLMPEEQFNLLMALAEAYADEPKRYTQKLECLQKAAALLPRGKLFEPEIARELQYEIRKIEAEREIYNEACRTPRLRTLEKQDTNTRSASRRSWRSILLIRPRAENSNPTTSASTRSSPDPARRSRAPGRARSMCCCRLT